MVGAIKRKNVNGGARHELDKFYTKDEVALKCLQTISALITQSNIVVEPSAGAGAFSKQIVHPHLVAYDLEPENDTIVEQDWFNVSRSLIGEGSLLVVGNPPFGVRSDLAKKFIRHAVSLGAETVAFVLPKTFSKVLNQSFSLFPKDYRLVVEEDLGSDSFIIEGKSFHIPCSWYVWTKNENFNPEIDLRKQKVADVPDFMFVPRGSLEADFVINGNNGKVKDLGEVVNPKAEHYIRVNDRNLVKTVRERFEQLNFDFRSSVNGGVAWVGKQEILSSYINLGTNN